MATKVKPLNERAWIRQVLARYEEIENRMPIMSLSIEEPPDWVYRAMGPLIGISHPKMKRIPFRKWTARDLGYFLGRQSALDQVMWGEVPLSAAIWQSAKKAVALDEKVFQLNSNPNWRKAIRVLGAGMLKWRALFKKFINDTLIAARARPYLEASAFLKAFTDGAVVSDADFDNRKVGVGERIAWVITLFWQPISKFKSVGELHRLLAAAGKSMGVEITLKRVEKLCNRIGLKFRKRGRPRKNKTNALLHA